MNDAIVVAPYTHREGLLEEYEAQLAAADVPFHLERIDLPGGANGFTVAKRAQFLRKMAENFIDYKVIYATDAFDVLFFGTKEELLHKAPQVFTCGAERNCYPEPHLAERISGDTPWCFCNAGLIGCHPYALLNWCNRVESGPEIDLLDQAWLNRRLADQSSLVSIDSYTDLFYVVSSEEDGSLEIKSGRLWNSRCDSFPSFFHFSGKCPTDRIRSILNR
jgi:hypothetical protein